MQVIDLGEKDPVRRMTNTYFRQATVNLVLGIHWMKKIPTEVCASVTMLTM